MHLLQVCERSFSDSCICFRYAHLYCLSSKNLAIRLRSLIPYDRYKQEFVSLNLSRVHPSVKIIDGIYSPALENGVVQVTPFLTLTDILYVSRFPVSLLSISQFTKYNNGKITFFFFIMCFRTCLLGRGLVRSMNEEAYIIWTIDDPYWLGCRSV